MEFPQYRKIIGFKRFYKIIGNKKFVELSFVNDKPIYSTIDAKLYPEQLRIMDMLDLVQPFTIMSNEEIQTFFPVSEENN